MDMTEKSAMSKTKVFVSFTRQDAAIAKRIAHALSEIDLDSGRPVTTFIDRDIASGSDFREAIQKTLRKSDAVLVVASSPERASNGWIGYEIGAAEALRKPVILATSDRHSLSEFPEDFSSVHSVIFDPDKPEGVAREIAGQLMSSAVEE
jgi:hypothetical protein